MDDKTLKLKATLLASLSGNLGLFLLLSFSVLLLSASFVGSMVKKHKPYAYLGEPPMHPAIGGVDHYGAATLTSISENIDIHIEATQSEKQKRAQLLAKLKRLDKPAMLNFSLKPYAGYKAGRHSASLSAHLVINGRVSSHFGIRRDPFNGRRRFHRGVDIAAKRGTKIFSPASGFVVFAGRKGGYGNVVEVQHDQSIVTRFAHLQQTLVSQGEVVHKGDLIARSGSTGRSTGPHLHLEVLRKGRQVDPEIYFDGLLGHRKKH